MHVDRYRSSLKPRAPPSCSLHRTIICEHNHTFTMTRNSSQTDYNSGVYSIPPTSNWIDTSHPVIKEPGTSKLGPLTAKPQSLKKKKTTIWEEHYPLIQPPNQYHHHRYGYFFHGLFTSDVTCAYRDAVIAFLVLLFSMTIISITGLIFCKEWGIPSQSVHVFVCRLVWLSSPYCASLALRHSTSLNRCFVWDTNARFSRKTAAAGLSYTAELEHSSISTFISVLSSACDAPTVVIELYHSSTL